MTLHLFKTLNWMSIDFRCQYNISILDFKSIHDLTPSYLNFFHHNTNRTCSSARGELTVGLPFARKDVLKKSFRILGANVFNALPQSVRDSTSLATFKCACFKHFITSFLATL